MAKSFAFVTVLLLTVFPAVAVGDGTPVCDVLNPFIPLPGCSCLDSASGTGGTATCTLTIPDPVVSIPAMSIAGFDLSPAVDLPQVTVQVGTEVKPCADPARAAIHLQISIPADVPTAIVTAVEQLVQTNINEGWSITTTDAELKLRIDQSAEAGQNLDIDIPFFVFGLPGTAEFRASVRITMAISGNAGGFTVATSVDTCMFTDFNIGGFFVQEFELCGATLPSCVPEHDCFMAGATWPGPWCCATNQMNLFQALGNPPADVFKMTYDFTDICNTAGPDPVDPNPAPNPNQPAAQSTADEGMDGGAIAGLVIGLLILFGIIAYAFVNRDKLPCINTKTQLTEVTELAIDNK